VIKHQRGTKQVVQQTRDVAIALTSSHAVDSGNARTMTTPASGTRPSAFAHLWSGCRESLEQRKLRILQA
jgi:hypothetical protein